MKLKSGHTTLEIKDSFDSEGLLKMTINNPYMDDVAHTVLSREQAVKLRDHLYKVLCD